MIYTEETKKKLDVILRAFAAYINSQNYDEAEAHLQ